MKHKKLLWIGINPPTDDNKKSKTTWNKCYICSKKLLVCEIDYWIEGSDLDKNYDYCSPLCVELGMIEIMYEK